MPETFDSLHDLFVDELGDMLNAEKQITQALPKMIEAATSPELKSKFQEHLKVTEEQIRRLEQVFQKMDMEPEEKHCHGMAGIIMDGEKMVNAKGDPNVKDAALIGAAQKVEHYEISSYGTLRTFAQTLGLHEVADLLQRTLKEEAASDKLLTSVAERSINKKAA